MEDPVCRLQPISIQGDNWAKSDPPKLRFFFYLDAQPMLVTGETTSELRDTFFLRIKDNIGLLLTPVDDTTDGEKGTVFLRLGVAEFYEYPRDCLEGCDEIPEFCWEKRKVRII